MGLISEVQTHKYRAWKSICTGLTFASIGFCYGILGPTMLDLQLLVGTTVEQITHVLPMRAFGSSIGSIASGMTLQYMDHQIALMVFLFLSSVALAIIPLTRTLHQLFFALFFSGFTGGYLCNCGNIYILHQWGKENAPFMQLIHFSFGLGAFIAPFIAGPFLKPISEIEIENSNYTQFSNSSSFVNQTVLKEIEAYVDPETLQVKYAYYITSCLSFLIFITFLLTYMRNTSNKPHPTREVKLKKDTKKVIEKSEKPVQEFKLTKLDVMKLEEVLESNKTMDKKPKQLKKHHRYVLVALALIFMHLIYGLELAFGSLLPAFAVKSDLHLTKAAASYASSLYWGCFTFFRLFTMVMVNYFSSRTMLIVDLVLIMIGNFILLPFGCVYEWALLLGSAFMGIGVSSAYPTWWGFMEQIMPVTSKVTAAVTVCSSLGEFVLPVLIGNYIESWPMFYIYVIFGYSSLAAISFAICCFWEYIINKYKNTP